MTGLLIVGFFGAMIALYATDLLLKARARARRMREMSQRLAAATDRADQQQQRRQAAARASVALTSVIPAITRPPGDPAHRPEPGHPAARRRRLKAVEVHIDALSGRPPRPLS